MIPVKLARQRYGGQWLARARAYGKTFEGQGDFALRGLAKELMAADVPDTSLHVYQQDVAGFAAIQSFRQLAEGTPVGV